MKSDETIFNSVKGTVMHDTNNFARSMEDSENTEPRKGMPKLVRIGAAGVGGLLLGGVGVMLTSAALPESDSAEDVLNDMEDEVYSEENTGSSTHSGAHSLSDGKVDFADNVNDDMSFSEAFAAARGEVGAGGAFVWHGNVYGTFNAQEWNAMSSEEQAEWGSHFDWNHIDTTAEVTETVEEPVETEEEPLDIIEEEQVEEAVEEEVEAVETLKGEIEELPEVEVLSIVDDRQTGIGYVEMNIDGHESYFIDEDGDGNLDVLISDLNDNGELDEGEMVNISDTGLTMQEVAANTGMDINVIEEEPVIYDIPGEDPAYVAEEIVDEDLDIDITDDQALDI